MKVRLVMNKSYTLQRFKPKYEAAQKYLDNEVLKDCTPYVPMDTGQLMRSGINATVIGSGEVVWSAPHASRCYYTGSLVANGLRSPKDRTRRSGSREPKRP